MPSSSRERRRSGSRRAFDNYLDNEKILPRPAPPSWQPRAGRHRREGGILAARRPIRCSSRSARTSAETTSCLFYSLAFLSITPGVIKEAIKKISKKPGIFVYGIADRKVGGIELQMPNGNIAPVFAAALDKNVPPPFNKEPTGGGGNRMHHKFVVIDFDKPTARVYLGSYNFSIPADKKNGENLLVIRDRRIAVSYTVEALRIFDHYHFRVAQQSQEGEEEAAARQAAAQPGEKPWLDEDYHRRAKDSRSRAVCVRADSAAPARDRRLTSATAARSQGSGTRSGSAAAAGR